MGTSANAGIASIALDAFSLATSLASSGINISEAISSAGRDQASIDRQLRQKTSEFVDASEARRGVLARQVGNVSSQFSASGFSGGSSLAARMEGAALATQMQDIIAEREFFRLNQEARLAKEGIVREADTQAINFALGGVGSLLQTTGSIAKTAADMAK